MSTERKNGRVKNGPYSREYLLASLLVILTDPKDNKALMIKCDPAYPGATNRSERQQGSNTVRRSR
ncbi:hypothetical protein BSK20_03560 [SR1 bacterium human oral taxon HOT-345]|nr:hypothetical protein BSK20_03560 [SR1 bacterium human oral taxon HOT-345]